MRRILISRIGAACAALWLGVAAVEPLATHDCEVHGAPSRHQGAIAGNAQHAHGGSATHRRHEHETGHRCNCLGRCCAGAPVALPTVGAPLLGIIMPAAPPAPLASLVPRPAEPKHARPPSIGPPVPIA